MTFEIFMVALFAISVAAVLFITLPPTITKWRAERERRATKARLLAESNAIRAEKAAKRTEYAMGVLGAVESALAARKSPSAGPKPRIKQSGFGGDIGWWCRSKDHGGFGETPAAAYVVWRRVFEMAVAEGRPMRVSWQNSTQWFDPLAQEPVVKWEPANFSGEVRNG